MGERECVRVGENRCERVSHSLAHLRSVRKR